MRAKGSPLSILVVDDNEIDRMAIARAFGKHRLPNRIEFANDGLEGLRMLQTGGLGSYYIILLDLKMPKMNGFEFLDAVRSDASLKRSIVYVLTTSEEPRDIDQAYARQAAGYIVKKDFGSDFSRLIGLIETVEGTMRVPKIDVAAES